MRYVVEYGMAVVCGCGYASCARGDPSSSRERRQAGYIQTVCKLCTEYDLSRPMAFESSLGLG